MECNEVDLLKEIAQTELAIENSEERVDFMLRDVSVDLETVVRARLYQSELKAYLRGLRFKTQRQNSEF